MHKIITSTNESNTYIQFWPTVAELWKNYGYEPILAFITNRNKNDELVKNLEKFGKVELFKPINKINSGNQAKITRLYLSTIQNCICTIVDIDAYLLNINEFNKWIKNYESDKLLAIGGNAYLKSPEEGKFPMMYTTAHSEIFKKINPNNNSYNDLLNSWNLKLIDNKENIFNEHNQFSDESLLRALIIKHKIKINNINRDDFVGMKATKRLDRANWKIDSDKLKSNFYIDCCPDRPLDKKKMKPVFEHLNLKNWNVDIKI